MAPERWAPSTSNEHLGPTFTSSVVFSPNLMYSSLFPSQICLVNMSRCMQKVFATIEFNGLICIGKGRTQITSPSLSDAYKPIELNSGEYLLHATAHIY